MLYTIRENNFKVGDRIFVKWPKEIKEHPFNDGILNTKGRICTAGNLSIPQTNKDELFVLWDKGGYVHLALLAADCRLNGTKIQCKDRVYSRPYLGALRPEYMTDEGANKANEILLSRGMPSLHMTGKGVVPNIQCVPASELQVFRSVNIPRIADFPFFRYVIGPFRTSRGAWYMAQHWAANNPHCQTVADAEFLSKE